MSTIPLLLPAKMAIIWILILVYARPVRILARPVLALGSGTARAVFQARDISGALPCLPVYRAHQIARIAPAPNLVLNVGQDIILTSPLGIAYLAQPIAQNVEILPPA